MIVLDQKEIMKNAAAAFEEYCKWIKQKMGGEFTNEDKPIFRDVFISGYAKAINDLVEMGNDDMLKQDKVLS